MLLIGFTVDKLLSLTCRWRSSRDQSRRRRRRQTPTSGSSLTTLMYLTLKLFVERVHGEGLEKVVSYMFLLFLFLLFSFLSFVNTYSKQSINTSWIIHTNCRVLFNWLMVGQKGYENYSYWYENRPKVRISDLTLVNKYVFFKHFVMFHAEGLLNSNWQVKHAVEVRRQWQRWWEKGMMHCSIP